MPSAKEDDDIRIMNNADSNVFPPLSSAMTAEATISIWAKQLTNKNRMQDDNHQQHAEIKRPHSTSISPKRQVINKVSRRRAVSSRYEDFCHSFLSLEHDTVNISRVLDKAPKDVGDM